MLSGQSSRTAERVAIARAAHQVLDSPLVLVDPLAIKIIDSSAAGHLRDQSYQYDRLQVSKYTRAIVVVRSRIAEDELAHAVATRGVTQYVLLGAGLDTFGYRNPHPQVRVFEVDHPATQERKRQRLADAGIDTPANVVYVPCDFSRDRLPDALARAGFDASRPAVCAWLGVIMYLQQGDIAETLRFIGSLPAGTSLVFDYALPPQAVGWIPRFFYRRVLKWVAQIGEPWTAFFEPGPLRTQLLDAGFTAVEDLGPAEINGRYLSGRRDGLRAGSVGHIITARKIP